jgi:hypothetical protein
MDNVVSLDTRRRSLKQACLNVIPFLIPAARCTPCERSHTCLPCPWAAPTNSYTLE